MRSSYSLHQKIDIEKKNHEGVEIWHYQGTVIGMTKNSVTIEAFFNHPDIEIHGMRFTKGDRFVEQYFASRWYNIYAVYDKDSDLHKGWYCNICRPAKFSKDSISFEDLALDLLVYPNKRYRILDEDEFDELQLSPKTRQQCYQALQELILSFQPYS